MTREEAISSSVPMKILVACEESQAVTNELRRLGHEAYSCDIIPCSGGHPEWHIMQDVLPLLNPHYIEDVSEQDRCNGIEFCTCDKEYHFVAKWDMIIAFPPCTDLAVSGARHFEKKRADGRQQRSIEFFCQFLYVNCDRIAIENPVGIINGNYIPKHFPKIAEVYGLPRKPTQIIQPYEYGHPAKKTTCLWLKGLPKLKPTNIVDPGKFYISSNGRKFSVGASADMARDASGKILSWNDPNTAKIRSKTFPGIARAMAEQWAGKVGDNK